ncbi:alkaline phosphatase PhoX [Haladaptatus sp. DFWS20]|uniref:alkaline phosphatase PhoX n=1 Tax=Haladaptatus sp. DFWS20 TaxID=3403467 RepID=UPI003EBBE24A
MSVFERDDPSIRVCGVHHAVGSDRHCGANRTAGVETPIRRGRRRWREGNELGSTGNAEASFEEYLGYFGNAYRYGFIVEIEDPTGADMTPFKHYSMGRFSHENAVFMPDRKPVYMSNDGTGTVFFKFVADRAGDLSVGTLYAAKPSRTAGTTRRPSISTSNG